MFKSSLMKCCEKCKKNGLVVVKDDTGVCVWCNYQETCKEYEKWCKCTKIIKESMERADREFMESITFPDMSMERKVMQEIMEKKKTAKYLVAYMFEGIMGGIQISSNICEFQNIPPTIEDVNRILEELKKVKMSENVVIINWLLLSDSGEVKTC